MVLAQTVLQQVKVNRAPLRFSEADLLSICPSSEFVNSSEGLMIEMSSITLANLQGWLIYLFQLLTD